MLFSVVVTKRVVEGSQAKPALDDAAARKSHELLYAKAARQHSVIKALVYVRTLSCFDQSDCCPRLAFDTSEHSRLDTLTAEPTK